MFTKGPESSYYLKIKLREHQQEIIVGNKIFEWIIYELKNRNYENIIILIDANVKKIYKDTLQTLKKSLNPLYIITVYPSEKSKSLVFLNSILEECYKNSMNRHGCIIGIGGGIVGDIAGFLSAIYMRGIEFVFIPTTLMAQGDTIINKVGISYKLLKNILGSFYSPVTTFCDTSFLQTLTKYEISLGLSEIIKHSLIKSKKFFDFLDKNIQTNLKNWQHYDWKNIIYRSLKIKAGVVMQDPKDIEGTHKGLSYGHTFANAFEGLSQYHFRHGESVAIGMKLAGLISKSLNKLSGEQLKKQNNLLKKVGLNIKIPHQISPSKIVKLLYKDKIASEGKINLVLLKKIGSFYIEKDVNPNTIISAIKSL